MRANFLRNGTSALALATLDKKRSFVNSGIVTRVVRETQIEHVIMGITVCEVSRLKERTNSFLMVYNNRGIG